ncbi:MAG: hypothetical protein HKN32_00725, partial [Flavobacteriales bacterium]|nr:hypothetical protein [Flavobacteriales bacterium]
ASGGAPTAVDFGVNDASCGPVFGCTDPNACNFNSEATAPDYSCTYPGCTDYEAPNYNSWAGCDDGSCFEPDCGTIVDLYAYSGDVVSDVTLSNFDGEIIEVFQANADSIDFWDQVCLPDGCYNLSIEANSDFFWSYLSVSYFNELDGQYVYFSTEQQQPENGLLELPFAIGQDCGLTYGCTDPWACNYDAEADYPDWNCTYPGCVDSSALNYNPYAGCDDGSCEYPVPCYANEVTLILFDSFGDGWNGAQYAISQSGEVLYSGTLEAGSYGLVDLCLEDGCFQIEVGGGSFDSEISWDLLLGDVYLASGLAPSAVDFGINDANCGPVFGCIDPSACNFNGEATASDYSCTYPGCTNPDSPNYNPWAGCDDGSCFEPDCGTVVDIYAYSGSNISDVTLSNFEGEILEIFQASTDSIDFWAQVCLPDGCYTLSVEASDAFFWSYLSVYYDYDQDGQYEYFSTEQQQPEGGLLELPFAIGVDCGLTFGCTDPWACNFDPEADYPDWNCTYPGCTDSLADNYNPYAGCDDGSCEYTEPCEGVEALLYVCTYANGWEVGLSIADELGNEVIEVNDLPATTISYFDICLDSASCYTTTMTNNTSTGWYGGYYWITVDGYQIVEGELDDDLSVELQSFSIGDNSCPIYGCTDPEALNYNAEATEDDGSCEYPEPCDFNQLYILLYDSFGDGWNGDSYTISNADGEVVSSGTLEAGSDQTDVLCLPDGCYFISTGGGSFDSENSWEIILGDVLIASGTSPMSSVFIVGEADCDLVLGCTDAEACNYSSEANYNDGSCCYPGCMDPSAINFDPWACCDNGGCLYGPENDLCSGAFPLELGTTLVTNEGAWL